MNNGLDFFQREVDFHSSDQTSVVFNCGEETTLLLFTQVDGKTELSKGDWPKVHNIVDNYPVVAVIIRSFYPSQTQIRGYFIFNNHLIPEHLKSDQLLEGEYIFFKQMSSRETEELFEYEKEESDVFPEAF